jgi:hypothetical protein
MFIGLFGGANLIRLEYFFAWKYTRLCLSYLSDLTQTYDCRFDLTNQISRYGKRNYLHSM